MYLYIRATCNHMHVYNHYPSHGSISWIQIMVSQRQCGKSQRRAGSTRRAQKWWGVFQTRHTKLEANHPQPS